MSRASVHNISILKGLKLGIGDRITVYKANMIIPQIAENLTCSDTVEIPKTCPVCGGRTQIRQINEVQSLYCTNEKCAAKRIKAFTLFVSRDAMNIDGMSEATLEKFIDRGFIREYADLFHLDRHREEITQMEGFGENPAKISWTVSKRPEILRCPESSTDWESRISVWRMQRCCAGILIISWNECRTPMWRP